MAKVLKLKELRAGADVFRSHGVSFLKVTTGGEAVALEIPVRSTGVAEVIERFRETEPKPPSKAELIHADSPVGRQMKMAPGQKQWVKMPDFSDPDYLAKRQQYEQEMSMDVIIQGLDIPLCDKDGVEIKDRLLKIEMLKGLGMSMSHFAQIVEDIQNLTTMSDQDRERFFDKSLDGTATKT